MAATKPRRRRSQPPIVRKAPADERSAAIVEALLSALEQVLEQRGPRGITTNHIAERAGVSVGTLYQYFANKEALVGALHDRYLHQVVDGVRAILAAAGARPIREVIPAVVAAMAAPYQRQRQINRWLVELRTAAGVHQRVHDVLDALTDELTRFLAARLDLRLPDPAATAFLLVHMADGVVNAVTTRSQRPGVAELEREATRLLDAYLSQVR